MNVTDYTYLMNKPDALTEKQTDALGSVLNEFPYFQSARALRLKGLYNQNSFKYNYALKVTAAHTADRSILFDFITSENFTSIQSTYYDQKLKDLLEIKVFGSEVISSEQINKIPQVRIDPIEQSILNSIKEATTVVFEEPSKIEEKSIEPIAEQPLLNSIKEDTHNTFEPVNAEETKIEPITEPLIASPSEEEILNTFVEVTKVEEKPIDPIAELSVIEAIKEVELVSFEETITTEEKSIEPISIEEPIVTPSEEEILNTFKEITETEEENIKPVIEEQIAAPSQEEILSTFKEVTVEEKTENRIIEEPIVTSVRSTPTFFEEVVEDEIPEVHVDPIEESILNSIKETSTVVFEEAEVTEEPEEIEVPETAIPEIVKIAEENLEIGKPIDFSFNEKHSFQEWLQLSRSEPIDRTTEAGNETESGNETDKAEKKTTETAETIDLNIIEEEKKKKEAIINRFIETNPKITPIKQTPIVAAVQFNINEEENSYLMTETLARVYLEQKKYTKAIQAYEILILKYPEKISFFADRISDIKILQQNNNNN